MTLLRRIRSSFAGIEPEAPGPRSFEMQSVGEILRRQRVASKIAIDEAAAALKIKPAYLLAIEDGRPFQLPGATYAVGFVRSYSQYLGCYSMEMVQQFKLECAGFNAKPDLTFPMPLAASSLPAGRVLALAAFLAVCAYGVRYYFSPSERGAPERVSEVPAEFLASKPVAMDPSKPAIAADRLPEGRGPGGASEIAFDHAEPPGSAAVAGRRSGISPAPNPPGSGPPWPETAAIPTATLPTKPIANSPAAAGGALQGAPGPAEAAAEVSSTVSARAGPPQSAEPAMRGSAAARESPPVARSTPQGVAITGAFAGIAAGGTPRTAAGLSAPPSQSDDADRAYGVPWQQPRITLRANADSWIQIRAANHSILFTGMLRPGDTYRVPDLPGLTMRCGNAGGLDVIIDGKPVSSLGPMGAVRNVSLSPQSLVGPSATHN